MDFMDSIMLCTRIRVVAVQCSRTLKAGLLDDNRNNSAAEFAASKTKYTRDTRRTETFVMLLFVNKKIVNYTNIFVTFTNIFVTLTNVFVTLTNIFVTLTIKHNEGTKETKQNKTE